MKKAIGFARLSPEERKAISSKGGVAAHRAGTAHEFTSDEGRAAAHKCGFAALNAKRKAALEAAKEPER